MLLGRLAGVVPAVCRSSAVTTRALATGAPALPFKLGKLNHVAIAVPDMEKASALYRDVLGATVSAPADQPDHGVTTIFVELGGDTKIELLYPLGEKSPIANFLSKNPAGGIHHVCLDVSDLDAAIDVVRQQKIRTLSDKPKIGAHGVPVMFLHPKDCNGVLVELQQEE